MGLITRSEAAHRLKIIASHLSCAITVRGDSMHLHFDGPPQVRAGLNMTMTATLSTVYYAIKTVVDPTILPNAGLARPLTVTAPAGSVVNCVHPAAINGRLSLCQRSGLRPCPCSWYRRSRGFRTCSGPRR